MSNPQNLLGQFRSYAYHHILMVCNNSEAAEALARTSEITVFQRARDEDRYFPRPIGGDDRNQYVTLIDGTTDARFYITSATWENIIAMEDYKGEGDIPQSTSMSLDGELDIMEPLGANFLNVLTNVCDTLDTDPVGLVFVLKTIFVGHNDDGTTEMISNIKPLLFINYDITAVFDSSGAKYKMSFVGAINGLGKLPQAQQIFKGFSFKINENDSLAETFTDVAAKINTSYDKFSASAQADYARTLFAEGTAGLTAEESVTKARRFFDSNYRPVSYKIIAPDYADKDKYSAGDNEIVRVANKQAADGAFNFGPDVSIEEIIKRIMTSTTGVLQDSKGIDGSKRYIYKITSGVRSNNDEVIVEYYVNRYEMLMLPYEAAFDGVEFFPAPGQSIEFDYIFTGQNVDVQTFDIKMEMGMAFFQIAATTDTVPTQKSTKQGIPSDSVKVMGSSCVASNCKTRRSKTPLFLGSRMKQTVARNSKNSTDAASFQALLNRHAALENIQAKMVIYGNPQLLGEMQVLPSELGQRETEPPVEGRTINPRWLNTPTLTKVNIKMPVDTNDVNTEYRDFWYTGYYTLFGVTQNFNEGEFTQELDMMSLPVSDRLEERPASDAPVPIDKEAIKAAYNQIDNAFNIEQTNAPQTDKQTVGAVISDINDKTKIGKSQIP